MPKQRRHFVVAVILTGLAVVAAAGCLAVPVPVPGPPAIVVPAPVYGGGYYRGYYRGHHHGHHGHRFRH